MNEKPISPLRQRMLEDMSLRGFTPDTQRDYIRAVKKLAAFLGRSPDAATAEDLRAFQLHLTASGVQPPTILRVYKKGGSKRRTPSLKPNSLLAGKIQGILLSRPPAAG
jgi:hypothetical protein